MAVRDLTSTILFLLVLGCFNQVILSMRGIPKLKIFEAFDYLRVTQVKTY